MGFPLEACNETETPEEDEGIGLDELLGMGDVLSDDPVEELSDGLADEE